MSKSANAFPPGEEKIAHFSEGKVEELSTGVLLLKPHSISTVSWLRSDCRYGFHWIDFGLLLGMC